MVGELVRMVGEVVRMVEEMANVDRTENDQNQQV